MNWYLDRYEQWAADVPCREDNGREGVFEIRITPRPHYCDRGDWLIHVDGTGSGLFLDGCDGFPRYFFGTADAVKTQMETWVRRRAQCQLPNAEKTPKP